MKNHLLLGNWNALCDSCGRKFKALDLKKDWRGLMVCAEDYELRHDQDFLRVQKEKIAVEFSRPYPVADTFTGYICSIYESQALADIATADCARAGIVFPVGSEEDEDFHIHQDLQAAIAGIAIAGYAISGKPFSLAPGQ